MTQGIVVGWWGRQTVLMGTSVDAELLERWVGLAGAGSISMGEFVIRCYREPHRRYHTVEHLQAMLGVIDDLAGDAEDIDAVRYAAFFHDAVYAVERDDNEELSARLAEESLGKLGVATELIAEVGRLVRLTATHRVADGDRNGAVLCDADLAVLAADEAGYVAYTAAVRAEYRHVPDELFRVGRAAVLQGLAQQPYLFRTPTARTRYEAAARTNLSRELATLTAAGASSGDALS